MLQNTTEKEDKYIRDAGKPTLDMCCGCFAGLVEIIERLDRELSWEKDKEIELRQEIASLKAKLRLIED
jgi:hypothetical protein